nr:hypothetical protein [Clostridiales bacterium]
EVTIPELINGERKSETMNENEKEVATTMADYATEEKSEILKSIRNQSMFGVCAIAVQAYYRQQEHCTCHQCQSI